MWHGCAAQGGSTRSFCRALIVSHCRLEASTLKRWVDTSHPVSLCLARLKAAQLTFVLASGLSKSKQGQDAVCGLASWGVPSPWNCLLNSGKEGEFCVENYPGI